MGEPQIVIQDWKGVHNTDIPGARIRLAKRGTYKDLSTVMIIPSPNGWIPAKCAQTWMNLMLPMNQKFVRMFLLNMPVDDAYNAAVETILNNTELAKFKFIFTVEWDNMLPPNALLLLYEGIQKFDVVQGLYWTKGQDGQPMIYGDPGVMPKNFIPQQPKQDELQECNGLGMGCNLFKVDIFRKMPGPWFKTVQEYKEGEGAKMYSQDLYFYENAAKYGFRFACDTRIKVGHYDYDNDMVW